MGIEYSHGTLAELEHGLRGLLPAWGMAAEASLRLLNVSENATWRASDAASGKDVILRVHRQNYHDAQEIASELAWIDALRRDGIVETPAILPDSTGQRIRTVASQSGEPDRHVVAFEFVQGAEPRPDAGLVPWFHELGAITARMHAHTARWQRPQGFRRKVWDTEAIFGDKPYWGDWRAAVGLDDAGRALMERAIAVVERRLAAFGRDPDRFGLIHCDLRLANLLVDGSVLRVIDFDDCGISWHLYDFAAAISFYEQDPIIPALQDAWVEGYRTVAPLPAAHVAELPVFIAMRRFLLTAWIASHAEVPAAQELGAGYTAGTLDIADRLLSAFA